MTHNERKSQLSETDPEMTQMTRLVDKDVKIVIIMTFHMCRKAEESIAC